MSSQVSSQKTKAKTELYQLGDVSPANIQQLKALNISTLPVRYSEKFYKELIPNYTTEYLKYAIWNGFVVGAVCARLEPLNDDPQYLQLYIMTINVLAPYRRRGIATTLLNHVTDKALEDKSIKQIYLNVQTSNDDAKQFYLSHGFEEIEIISNYYKGIEPPDAFLLRKNINRDDPTTADTAGADSASKDVADAQPTSA